VLNQERLNKIQWLLLIGWTTSAILIIIAITHKEGKLEDPNAVALLDYGLSRGYIQIVQQRPDEPLRVTYFKSNASPDDFGQTTGGKVVFTEQQWKRVEKLVRQFVAMANWGLGDPFLYEERGDGTTYVKAFHAADFAYHNPFDLPAMKPVQAVVASSDAVSGRRPGWRIISPEMLLILREGASEDEVVINQGDESSRGACRVGKRFLLKSPDGSALRLSIGSSAVAEDKSTRLQIESISPTGQTLHQQRVKSGEYFVWNSVSFTAYSTNAAVRQPESSTSEARPAESQQTGNLVFTKYVNGSQTQIHLLGEATTNLIGAKLGGYTPYLYGAIKHDAASRITLTLDPDLQAGAYSLLRSALLKLDGYHPLERPRRGALTILDLESGGILAQVGYPSFEADWAANRRVLIERNTVAQNPARETHMPGSSVKVLTVAMGYLIFGHAQSELLPPSNNVLAVRQAFQDCYGAELTAPLTGAQALVTPEAREQFQSLGGRGKVTPQCLYVLQRVFLLSPDKDAAEGDEREPIVSQDMLRFFDERKLKAEFFPPKSSFPILNADSMERFRHYALGAEDTRFTTLRLASVLATASTARVFHPFIVESVTDKSNVLWKRQDNALNDIELPWGEAQYRTTKMLEITQALRKVLLPGGTGYFYTDKDVIQYLGADDPSTTEINEARSREADYGKSGTADYGDPESFQDSLFVYRHGRYAMAVWLEHADRGEESHPGHRPFERHLAHKLTGQILRLIESLESTNE
jgi:hypothetical protein